MDIRTNAKCAVFGDSDLEDSALRNTLKTIEHNPEKFYLLASDSGYELHEAIEKLSEYVKNDTSQDYELELTRIRFARNLKFALPVCFADGEALSTLSELLEALSYDESLKLTGRGYQVIIDDDGVEENNSRDDPASIEVVRLFQQLVYLNLNLDIKKKSELRKSQVKNRFRAMHKELQAEAQNRITALQPVIAEHKIGTEGIERVQKIMQKAFDEGKVRTLKIAAMGTKKAGKSVIINSILGRDYAPTSSELPTPNVVRYIPCSEDTPLTLDYRGST